MNRPAAAIGIVFEEDLDVGVVELVSRQDAEFVADLEENHGATGKAQPSGRSVLADGSPNSDAGTDDQGAATA
ncbi:MAG: hypothetical protein E5Y60_07755 [Mesorhizobium sp.]|nr:MAG: hypothetical protein E5Y60_07755 [Mesorhizobium sp.]